MGETPNRKQNDIEERAFAFAREVLGLIRLLPRTITNPKFSSENGDGTDTS